MIQSIDITRRDVGTLDARDGELRDLRAIRDAVDCHFFGNYEPGSYDAVRHALDAYEANQ